MPLRRLKFSLHVADSVVGRKGDIGGIPARNVDGLSLEEAIAARTDELAAMKAGSLVDACF